MNSDERHNAISIARAVEVLGQKWIAGILCQMQHGPVRLGQLTRALPRASKKSLTANLRWLERVGIIARKDLSGVRLHVEYDMLDNVRVPLTALLRSLAAWGATLPPENWPPENATSEIALESLEEPQEKAIAIRLGGDDDQTGHRANAFRRSPPVRRTK